MSNFIPLVPSLLWKIRWGFLLFLFFLFFLLLFGKVKSTPSPRSKSGVGQLMLDIFWRHLCNKSWDLYKIWDLPIRLQQNKEKKSSDNPFHSHTLKNVFVWGKIWPCLCMSVWIFHTKIASSPLHNLLCFNFKFHKDMSFHCWDTSNST